jgi:hypothetical protein
LRADARVRVQRPLQICLGRRSKSKKCDKQLTFIVRVISRNFVNYRGFKNLSKGDGIFFDLFYLILHFNSKIMKSLTYKQIQSEYSRLYGKPVIQSCWIADVKRELGLTKRIAHNRKDKNSAVKPCPEGLLKDRLRKIILSI